MKKPKSKRKPQMSVGREVAAKCISIPDYTEHRLVMFDPGIGFSLSAMYTHKIDAKMWRRKYRKALADLIDTTITQRNKRNGK